jgi:sec-independent protein translocase protein TatB
MFNIGGGEMVVIFLLALLVLGPERLPKAMGQVGRAVAQMRKLSGGFQDEIRRAMDPLDAPFRPGEQTLRGPMPSITDEVRVVATEGDATNTPAEGEPAFPDPAEAAPEPARPDLAKGPATDDPGDAAGTAVEPETQALVVDDDPGRPGRTTVTPLRPRPADDADASAGTDGDGDQATG